MDQVFLAAFVLNLMCAISAEGAFSTAANANQLGDSSPFVTTQETGSLISDLVFTNDDTRLLASHLDGSISVWSFKNGKLGRICSKKVADQGISIAASANAEKIAFHAANGKSIGFAAFRSDLRSLDNQTIQSAEVARMAVSPDGSLFAHANWQGATLYLVRASPMGAKNYSLLGHTQGIEGILFSRARPRLYTVAHDETVRIWDISDPQRPTAEKFGIEDKGNYLRLFESPCGSKLFVASHVDLGWAFDVVMFDLRRKSQKCVFRSPMTTGEKYRVVEFSADLNCVFTGGSDGTICHWELKSNRLVSEWRAPGRPEIRALALSQNGRYLLTADWHGVIRVMALTPRRLAIEGVSGPRQPRSIGRLSGRSALFCDCLADSTTSRW